MMMNSVVVAIVGCLVFWFLLGSEEHFTSPTAGYIKRGNNGTVTCDQYCKGDWGRAKYDKCVGAYDNVAKKHIECGSARGYNAKEVTCMCDHVRSNVKNGNNGSVNCDEYCRGMQWGAKYNGCIKAIDTNTNTSIHCSKTRGYRVEEVSCYCDYKFMQLYAGGVIGLASLANPRSSDVYRSLGGAFFLHHTGFVMSLNDAQRQQIARMCVSTNVAIELGFSKTKDGADAWAGTLRNLYFALKITPDFLSVNCFMDNNIPTVKEWEHYMQAMRAVGLNYNAYVFPAFEFANFAENIPTLIKNKISIRTDFQTIIRMSKGMVLDVPPGYFFKREQAYRDWVLDAMKWCMSHGFQPVWIASPHDSGVEFKEHTFKCLRFMLDAGVAPSRIIVENYEAHDSVPKTYPNVVGHENAPATTLGVARALQDYIAKLQ